ncbi:MAG: MnhB domain-containing protein [Proteocatella sp.]
MINDHSRLVSRTLGLLYPFLIITGIYIITNGHISPGGGFQGGALFASVFICKYLIDPVNEIRLGIIQYIEKIALIFIILLALAFLLTGFNRYNLVSSTTYFYIMNVLIGLKVACGMSVIFYRFIFYESR